MGAQRVRRLAESPQMGGGECRRLVSWLETSVDTGTTVYRASGQPGREQICNGCLHCIAFITAAGSFEALGCTTLIPPPTHTPFLTKGAESWFPDPPTTGSEVLDYTHVIPHPVW